MENQLFNLEKIKEITEPVETLQGNLNYLENINNKFNENKSNILPNFTNKDFLNQIQELNQLFKDINDKLIKISHVNINNFLFFQDKLIKKYRDSFKDKLKELKLQQNFTKEIGLFLIENRKICKIIEQPSYVFSIELNQWLDVLDSLNQNSLFKSVIKRCNKFYKIILEKKLKIELSKIPQDIDPILIEDFKKTFFLEPDLSFKEFLQDIEHKLNKEELKAKKKAIEKTRENKNLEKLKKTQKQQQKSYNDYFRLSNKEFERVVRKKKREKLSDLEVQPNETQNIEISEEITEKIEKFKSKFEKSFEEKYLIQKDEEKDPLELIRERQDRKKEEYKTHSKKFKDMEK